MLSIREKIRNLRIKLFLWLIGKENHEMWYELQKRYVTDLHPDQYGMRGEHSEVFYGSNLLPVNMYLEDYTRIQNNVNFIGWRGKLRLKKYAAVGAGCIIVPNNHVPTVGVPQFLAGHLHINDVVTEIIIGEDAWVGAGTILLSHCQIGRGAVVAAGAVVSKPVPPYAVVAGIPAKIIATRFTLEQILEHESILYPPEERMSKGELEKLFAEYYQGKKPIGKSDMTEEDRERLKAAKQELGMQVYS